MIAAISLMRRQDEVDLATFRRHWLDVHGPLVCAFAGLRYYAQCHALNSPAMNARAREMRVDGFPILFFDTDADRKLAHGSPEMAACNINSRQFVGAVSRVVAETTDPLSNHRIGAIWLYPADAGAAEIAAHGERIARLPGLLGLNRYRVLEQGPAPNSTVPHLPVSVAAVAQGWFGGLVDLECALSVEDEPRAARFVIEAHWQM